MWCKLSAAVIMLQVFHLSLAQVPFPNQCPEVKLMETFDLDAYMGIWYEYSKYPFVFEIGKKCMYARYTHNGNLSVDVVNAAVNRFTGRASNTTGEAYVLGPGQLAVVFSQNQDANKANYLVLGTDYKTYAIVYSCSNLTTLAHTKVVWILTRERKPNQTTVDAAFKVLDDNKLSKSFLIDTLQEDCPEPSDTSAVSEAAADDSLVEPSTDLDSITNSSEPTNALGKA